MTAGRWGVEQCLALLHQYRRLAIRWERRTDSHQGFLDLVAAFILWLPDRAGCSPRMELPERWVIGAKPA
ncbi:hypothetical protein ACIHAX_36860 [Nocardia sp. NPDC051929]|uniref:hypothetical protein n=1 Tax=unclassified Nocardia TaxID=2637762 RepID=UPI00343E5A45